MEETNVTPTPAQATPEPITRAADPQPDTQALIANAQTAERERVGTIYDLASRLGLERSLAEDLVGRGVAIDEARRVILDKVADTAEKTRTFPHVSVPLGGRDERLTRREAVANALLHRYSPTLFGLSDPAREYRGMTLLELSREFLASAGVNVRGMSRDEIATRALHSTSDFPEVLSAVTNKTLRQAYDVYPRTFVPFCRQVLATDFKAMNRVQLGEAPQLLKVSEGGEFKRGTISESKESYRIETYGRVVAITRQVLINDDLDAFTRIPAMYGTAIATLESDVVWGIVTANAAMADGVALFHATHKNLAGTGTALSVAAVGAVGMLCGWAVALLFRWWARRYFLRGFSDHPADRYEKISYQLAGGAIALVATLLFAIVGWGVSEYVQGEEDMAHRTAMIMIATAVFIQIFMTVIYGLLSPGNGAQRIIAMDDRHARGLAATLTLVQILGGALFGINAWFKSIDLDDPTHDLFSIITTGVAVVLLGVVCAVYRKPIANALVPQSSETRGVARWLARRWYVIGITYFVFAWLVRAIRVLLDQPNSEGLVAVPVLVLFVGLAIYGITLLLIVRLMKGGVELHVGGPNGRRLPSHRDLVERGAAIAYTVLGFAMILNVWGVNVVGGGAWGGRVFDALVVVFFGWLVYDVAKLTIDRKIASEDPTDATAGQDVEGDVPMATAKTRLATLLPLVRVLVLSTIAITIMMMALTQVGVNITPLFAGAGVVGLAIGFGSRQLVEDVISGAFYLADDAFRVGEYIDIGKVKGTVERISVRSFQLRHQNGPLNTIRFGEVSHVTNFSRDWAIMKLPIRVPLDADSEKIRKIIKKVGQDLADDPELGPKFLQPLKSQGVYQMDDSALIIRVKFMTRPNDQFILRRVVYHRIQEAFHKAGIHFANRVVTVRVEGDNTKPGTPEAAAARQMAITQAAQDAIDANPLSHKG